MENFPSIDNVIRKKMWENPMKTFSQLGLMLVLIIIVACGQVSKKSPIDIESEREAVMAEFKSLIVVSESGDVEGYMNHLCP